MSSIPLMLQLIDDCEPDWYTPYDFGIGIQPHLISTTRRPSARRQPILEDLIDYTWPLKLLQAQQQLARRGTEGDDTKLATIGKDGFKVRMNVEQFKPEELNVKVVDNTIVVEGKHEEREDEHGYIQRHFVRRYTLPKGYEADKVESSLSSDGLLTVSVPKPQAIEDKSKERVVQIQQTGVDHRQSIKDKQQSPPESAAKEKKSPAA